MATHIGQNYSLVHTTPRFELGTRVTDELGREFVYCKSGGTIATEICVKLATGYVVTASGNAGFIFGVTRVASVINEYLWVQTKGKVESANVATGVSAGAVLREVSDANGDFVGTTAVNEGGATSHAAGLHTIRALALANESGGLADVYLT